MKKKALALMLGMMLAVSATACGGDSEPETAAKAATEAAAESETEAEEAEEVEETEAAEETEAEAADSEGFSLMDVTTDMIDQGMYAKDDAGNELVISLFTSPSGTPMISMFMFSADGTGDVVCGSYGSDNVSVTQTEEGVDVSTFAITDVYTGDDFALVCAEKDGVAYVGGLDGSLFEGSYLTPDETIVYMGTAVALLGQQ